MVLNSQIDKASALVEAARKAGADSADAVIIGSRSVSVSVRLGKVESTEASENDDFSLRVFVGKRVASISANLSADPASLAERAVAMAKVSPENPFEGLADRSLLVKSPKDLDLYDPFVPDSKRLTEEALEIENAEFGRCNFCLWKRRSGPCHQRRFLWQLSLKSLFLFM